MKIERMIKSTQGAKQNKQMKNKYIYWKNSSGSGDEAKINARSVKWELLQRNLKF